MSKKEPSKRLDTFQWIGISARGKRLEGELTGSSIALVKAQLRKQGITPSKVKRKAKPLFGLESVQKITPKDISLVPISLLILLLVEPDPIISID